MKVAPVIKVSKAELRARRSQIFKELGIEESVFNERIQSDVALSEAEWSAKEELEEIEFLLGNGTRTVC